MNAPTASLRERCDMFVRCLPQAPMRDRLARLFEDLLAGPHHRSAVGAPGSNKPESDSESDSDFAALRAVPHQPTGARNGE